MKKVIFELMMMLSGDMITDVFHLQILMIFQSIDFKFYAKNATQCMLPSSLGFIFLVTVMSVYNSTVRY